MCYRKSPLSELLQNLIDIRGMVESGTDDNQDRIPFRDQYRAMDYAVLPITVCRRGRCVCGDRGTTTDEEPD